MASETNTLRPIATLGFIGLGVMGEPMCGHLARRSGRPVLAHDLRREPLARLAADGVTAAQPAEIAAQCDLILLSLPDGKAVASVVAALEPHLTRGPVRGGHVHLVGARSPARSAHGWPRAGSATPMRPSPARAKPPRAANSRSWWAPPMRCSPMSVRCWRRWAPT